MGLKQHQHFKNLQEHSFQKIVTIFLIPVILPGGDKLSKVSDENLTMPKPKTTTKKQSNLPPPLTIKQSNVNTQDLTHRCTGCAVWVFFPPQPGTHTTKSDLQILPHPLCATPSKSPSLTASELHCRIAHCHLHHHHHHPKLSHNTPPPDLNPQSEPEANIQALGFSKYVTILEIANQGDSLDSILPGMETE